MAFSRNFVKLTFFSLAHWSALSKDSSCGRGSTSDHWRCQEVVCWHTQSDWRMELQTCQCHVRHLTCLKCCGAFTTALTASGSYRVLTRVFRDRQAHWYHPKVWVSFWEHHSYYAAGSRSSVPVAAISLWVHACDHIFSKCSAAVAANELQQFNFFLAVWLRLKASAFCVNSSVLKVVLTKSYDLYLLNTGDVDLEVRCGELFGFGLSSWTEKLAGHRFRF